MRKIKNIYIIKIKRYDRIQLYSEIIIYFIKINRE